MINELIQENPEVDWGEIEDACSEMKARGAFFTRIVEEIRSLQESKNATAVVVPLTWRPRLA